eukprot:TRINITY_DN1273_c1_g1_i1.p1 TRINITY_DN1273_c1_g1~~TRINITY_DN1273_c1_g1_i1.p1  ORF type:complete len:343 (+),score=105.25 TRINITY_DN1273_c1_g1_i1:162-1190(+)
MGAENTLTQTSTLEKRKTVETNYTVEEVAKHKTESDGWVIIEGEVYDISEFLELHPGGKKILKPYLGRDASNAFKNEKIHKHSTRAFNILQKYKVGRLEGGDISGSSVFSHPLAKLVDFEKAVLPQVINMPPKLYQEWLHGASIGTTTFRIFATDFFESMSRYPWWYILPLWLPVVAVLLYNSASKSSLLATTLAFPFGYFLWGAVEYVLHRFIFHMESETVAKNFIHFFAHGIHHIIPLDPTRLTFPPSFAIPLVFLIYQAACQVMDAIPFIEGLLAGVLMGYVMYDTMHYYFHHGDRFKSVSYFNYMKKRHTDHHYKSPNSNYGVTTPLFDMIFGTSAPQ